MLSQRSSPARTRRPGPGHRNRDLDLTAAGLLRHLRRGQPLIRGARHRDHARGVRGADRATGRGTHQRGAPDRRLRDQSAVRLERRTSESCGTMPSGSSVRIASSIPSSSQATASSWSPDVAVREPGGVVEPDVLRILRLQFSPDPRRVVVATRAQVDSAISERGSGRPPHPCSIRPPAPRQLHRAGRRDRMPAPDPRSTPAARGHQVSRCSREIVEQRRASASFPPFNATSNDMRVRIPHRRVASRPATA